MTVSPKELGEIPQSFLSCLDKALDIYGDSFKQVVYWNFEKSHGLTKAQIPAHADKFAETLNKIFGPGSSIVERTLISAISKITGLKGLDGYDFSKALREVNKYFQRVE
ncbi:MAG: hypothetical protein JRN67_01250 [Nitrososphaerota archaeon]|nr:hypothetical protein [Nitrososphaerota archaeon]